MFIQTQPTPNPNTVKFLPGREVAPLEPHDFADIEAATASPLAEALFEIEGVAGVFFGEDYLSVSRRDDGPDWTQLRPSILGVIMDHFTSGQPLMRVGAGESDIPAEPDSEVVAEIKQLLDTRVRPAVAQDGGDIQFDRFDETDGALYLRLRGACAGCPSSAATLKSGIETMMRHYVPEVTRVEQTL